MNDNDPADYHEPVSRAARALTRRTLSTSELKDDKEVAVKLGAIIGAVAIGALFALLGIRHKKARDASSA